MNLADMLSYADIQELSRIADNYQCECNGHSKNELIQSILSTVNRKDVLKKQMDEMTIEELRFLNSLIFDPRGTFSMEELAARVQQSRFNKEAAGELPSPRETIIRFKQRGWLFNGHSQHTRYLFAVPADLKRRFIVSISSKLKEGMIAADQPPVYREEQHLLADDLAAFLKYLREQEVMLTAEHTMYKRSLQQVIDRFAVQEEPVGKTAWRFGYGRKFKEYPNRLSLIYDYCYYHDLITEHRQVLALTEEGRSRADGGVKEPSAQLYRFWLRLYKGAVPNIYSIVYWINVLAKDWVTSSSLSGALHPFIRPFYYDEPSSIFEQRIVLIMLHLGMLRIGEHPEHGRVIQMTKLGSRLVEGLETDEDPIDIEV